MTKREPSLRAQARARYREAAAKQESPTRPASALRATAGDLPLSGGGKAVDTPLTTRVRALYEDSVVPVREIARLAGVTERTIFKYAQKGGWRRRHRCLAREDAAAAAAQGLRLEAVQDFAPVKGAGGRYIRREDASLPHARGLKALDPSGAAVAAESCIEADALSEAAVAEATAEAQARAARALRERRMQSDLRTLDILSGALTELVTLRNARPEGASPRADRLDALLQDAILSQIGRLGAGGAG